MGPLALYSSHSQPVINSHQNVMVMSSSGMEDVMLRERLPALWRRIEDAHYSYLEIDDSPEKLLQKKKLEGYILEYLTLVPHECKFGLAETGKVFQRTINELPDYSAYRAGIGWAAIARYAGNLLSQPWRKEYRVIRLYSGFFKHEVEPHLVDPESLLQALGYRAGGAGEAGGAGAVGGAGRLALQGPVCPDMAAAVSRDALIAYCECQIMCEIWEAVWGGGGRVSWAAVARERASRASTPARAAARLAGCGESEIYSNVPATSEHGRLEHNHTQYQVTPHCYCTDQIEEPVQPIINPYLMPKIAQPHMVYELPSVQCNPMPMMTPYGVPYYYPVQTPYMIPTPVYAPIKHATNIPVNGYPPMYLDMPAVPTAQLIELEGPSVYENGKFGRQDERSHRKTRHVDSKRTSKSGFSDVSLPSLPRSDTQPTLSKAKEDGMGTYESWDYVFRNLSSKDRDGDSRSGFSQSLDRDSRTLDRLDREERRSKYQPTTLDLEDGLQALNLDRSYDEDVYRTAKVNENLMRLKQEQELKKTRQIKKQVDEKRPKRTIDPVGNPKADGLITPKVAPDKIKLLTKKEVKDRKDVIKQQNSVNGSVSNMTDVKKVKKPAKLVSLDADKKPKPVENGVHKSQSSKSNAAPSGHSNHELKAQLVVSLDEPDHRRSPKQNGEGTPSRASDRQTDIKKDKWQCGTCTYLNRNSLIACEMCGKSRKGPEIEPLTSGGRECPACTLVNKRDARACDACGTGLEHCPTYI